MVRSKGYVQGVAEHLNPQEAVPNTPSAQLLQTNINLEILRDRIFKLQSRINNDAIKQEDLHIELLSLALAFSSEAQSVQANIKLLKQQSRS